MPRKKIRTKSKWNQLVTAFLIGVILTSVGLSILIRFTGRKIVIVRPVNEKDKNIIAPYYTEKSFEKQILKNASKTVAVSAQIKIPIIMYHYVEYVQDAKDIIRKKLDISPYIFENQLSNLKDSGYETYFVKDVPDILAKRIIYSPKKSVILTFDDGYVDFYNDVFPLLKKYQMRATVYVIYNYVGRRGFLNKDQLIELSHSGLVEIGSHTLDHLYLKVIPKDLVRKEIFNSKKQLEDLLGMEIKTFAYPYGAFNDESLELVKEASYSAAVSVIPGVMQSSDNLFYLNRIRPGIFSYNNIIQVLESLNK